MGFRILDVGDTAYYPVWNLPSERPMKVLDNKLMIYGKGSIYTRYLYDKLLDYVVEDMRKNVENEYDNLIVIAGKEGTGKSNLAYTICKMYKPDFDVEDGYIYDFEGFISKLMDKRGGKDRGQIFWMDEATNIASNRDWMVNTNKRFVQMLEMMRSRGWTLIMCIPSLDRLDVYIRQYRLRYLFKTLEMEWDNVYTEKRRGYFELQVPRGPEKLHSVGYGIFPKMPPETKAEYEEIKAHHQNEKLQEIAQKAMPKKTLAERYKERNVMMMYRLREQGMSCEEIGKLCDMDISSVRNAIGAYRKEHGGDKE